MIDSVSDENGAASVTIIFTITEVDTERFSLFWAKHALVPQSHQLLSHFIYHLLQLGLLEQLETIHHTLPLQTRTVFRDKATSGHITQLKLKASHPPKKKKKFHTQARYPTSKV